MGKYTSVFAMLVMGTAFTGTYSEPSQASNDTATAPQTTAEASQYEFEDLDDRFSYAYGIDLAKKFKAEGIELNVDTLADAMKAVFEDGERQMSDGEVAATMEIYSKIFTKKKEAAWAVAAEKNKKEGEEFLAENARKDGVIVTDSGLQYEILEEGNGSYHPNENDEVTVHYRGTFIDGTEFDSTHQRNEPYNVKVKQLIDGWSEALQLMSEGSKWKLYIPSDIAYGERGSGQHVGPNAVLIFEVELLDITESKG